MSYQEEQFSKIANSIRVMQGGTTDTFSATDFANQIRNIDRDSLPYKSTIALEDNYVVVDDSLDDELDDMIVYGASEQTVTEQGKNLFDTKQLSDGEIVTFNGVPCYAYVDDASLGFKYYGDFAENAQYTLTYQFFRSVGNQAVRSGIMIHYTDGTAKITTTDSATITTVTSTADKTIAYISSGYFNEKTCYLDLSTVQLELGSEATDYTPFVPDSPSPDYPAEIRSVGGEVAVHGKNLFDITQAVSPLFVANGDGTYTYTADGGYGFANRVEVDIPANTPYTLSIDCGEKSTTKPSLYIVVGKSDGTNSYGSMLISGNTRNSTVYTHDYDVVSLRFYTEGWTDGDSVEINNIQLELGSEATAYTPYYAPTTIEIPTLYAVTNNGNDVHDLMYVDRAQERAWVERNVFAYSFTGAEDWITWSTWPDFVGADENLGLSTFSFRANPEPLAYGGLCSHAPFSRNYAGSTSTAVPMYRSQGKSSTTSDYLSFKIAKALIGATNDETSAEMMVKWKTWLTEQYDAGTPVTITYPRAEPLTEELDYTALPTHFGGTTIMITPSDDSPSPVVAEVTLRTITDHENENVASTALMSMGVIPSGDTETDLASLAELGVDPYSVTSYDTSENYADAVEAMGVQPTNDATTNINILNELGVNVYE